MLTSADGSTIVEHLEAMDAVTHRISYSLLADSPFRDCLTIMAVCDLGPSQAELTSSATFQADGIPANEAPDMLEGALTANCLALKQSLEG
jgi:hypothetical protein